MQPSDSAGRGFRFLQSVRVWIDEITDFLDFGAAGVR